MHSVFPFLLAMVISMMLSLMLASKRRVSYPLLLLVTGLIVGFITHLNAAHINPDLIFTAWSFYH